MERTQIKNFQDLTVYKNLYNAMKRVHLELLPYLPPEERYDLRDQMSRASKGAPALIAEGFAKRYQTNYWKKYLNDCQGECNEMINHLSVCIDLYNNFLNVNSCKEIQEIYQITCKQITKLGQAWKDYHDRKTNF